MSTTLNMRAQMKNDSTANWAAASDFIARKGEIIVYNENPPKIKIGDGVTKIGELPFLTSSVYVGDTQPTQNYDVWVDTSEEGAISLVYTQEEKNKLAKIDTDLIAEQKTGAINAANNAISAANNAQAILETIDERLESVKIDDTVIGSAPWSSKNIVDALYLPIEENGNPVVCYPIKGYPMEITASWKPWQRGSGEPSSTNIRKIVTHQNISIQQCQNNLINFDDLTNQTISNSLYNEKSLGFTLTAGTIYTLTYDVKTNVADWYASIGIGTQAFSFDIARSQTQDVIDSLVKISCTFSVTSEQIANYGDTLYIRPVRYFSNTTATYDVSSFRLYEDSAKTLVLPEIMAGGRVDLEGNGTKEWELIDSYNGEVLTSEWISDRDVYAADGTPTIGAQVAYKLTTPISFTATGGEPIYALAGINTISTDADSLTVIAREDLLHTLSTLGVSTS